MNEDKEINPVKSAQSWMVELNLAKREDEKFVKTGKRIVRRYRDDRNGYADTAKKYNILWSNIQTVFPALYSKTPKAEVDRRYKDSDPVGRTAAQILERSLQYEIDTKNDFDSAMKSAILDRLLPGRGVCWVRLEKESRAVQNNGQLVDVDYYCTPVDYVYWEDFRCSPARNWEEVTWVGRRVYMSKDEGIERFGESFASVPLTHEPIGLEELSKTNNFSADASKKAQVWEIWDKTTKKVYWLAEGHQKLLDFKEDLYGLDNFWPCPKPLFATLTTDTLVPVADYLLYKDQAEEIDLLTNRINLLIRALKVVGVYDASQTSVQRLLSEGVDNTLIPVDKWAAFGEKGGLKGVVDFLPLDQVMRALAQCYSSREQAKQVIYEVTGLSDIIRGASVASETATAQQIKSQFASLRLREMQKSVAMFASEILRIKAQLISDFYSPRDLIEMSGIEGTVDAAYAEQAIVLLRSEQMRNFRIEVSADSLSQIDEQAEKQSRVEFLQATGGFLQQAISAAEKVPEMAPLFAEMLLFGVRGFKAGRSLEGAFDAAMQKLNAPKPPQAPAPSPEQIKAQAQMEIEKVKLQGDAAIEQMRIQANKEIEAAKMQHELQLEQFRMQMQIEKEKELANLDANTKLAIAEAQRRPDIEQAAAERIDSVRDQLAEIAEHAAGAFTNEALNHIADQLLHNAQQVQTSIMQLSDKIHAKKKIIRDDSGKAVGIEILGEFKPVERDEFGRLAGI